MCGFEKLPVPISLFNWQSSSKRSWGQDQGQHGWPTGNRWKRCGHRDSWHAGGGKASSPVMWSTAVIWQVIRVPLFVKEIHEQIEGLQGILPLKILNKYVYIYIYIHENLAVQVAYLLRLEPQHPRMMEGIVISSKAFFPTKLCGALVFRSAPPRPGTSASASASSHTIIQLCHTQLCHIQLRRTHKFVTHNFVTHTFVTHNFVTHTQLCHIQLGHTHNFVTHTQLCHTQIFVTHNFVTHNLSLGDICLRFTWQAWHLVTSTVVLRGKRGTYGTGLALVACLGLPWRCVAPRHFLPGRHGTSRHPPPFHVAGVALGDIYRRFAWQAWYLWDWAASGGALGSPVTPRGVCVAGVALGDICRRFTWQAWHLTSTVGLRGRRGIPMGLGWLWWRAWISRDAAWRCGTFCVAGVALGDICRRFAWQAWHLATSTVALRGRRGTFGTGLALVARLDLPRRRVAPRHFCVAGVALGDICRRFTWHAWHLGTSIIVVSRGRRGTYGTGLPLVARLDLPWRRVAPRHFWVAGVALCDICRRFTWQAWHLGTSTFVLRGRRGTWRHWRWFCVAGAARGDIHLGFCVAGLSLIGTHNFVIHTPTHTHTSLSHTTLSHTHTSLSHTHTQLCHTLSFTHNFHIHTHLFVTYNFVTPTSLSHTALSHTIVHAQLCHTHLSVTHTQLCHTPSFPHNFVTHNFVTHHLCQKQLCHTPSFTHIFVKHTHTQLCHTPSFTYILVTHHLSHTSLSHTIFIHNVVTHHLPHTSLSHTIFHTHLCYTPSFTHILVTHHLCHTPSSTHTHNFSTHILVTHHLSHTTLVHTTLHIQPFTSSIIHHRPCLSCLPRAAATLCSDSWKKLTCGVVGSFNCVYESPRERRCTNQRFPRTDIDYQPGSHFVGISPILWDTTRDSSISSQVNPTGFLSTTPGGAREEAVCRRGVAVCCNLALCRPIGRSWIWHTPLPYRAKNNHQLFMWRE